MDNRSQVLRIMRMVENGKISAEEGAALIKALSSVKDLEKDVALDDLNDMDDGFEEEYDENLIKEEEDNADYDEFAIPLKDNDYNNKNEETDETNDDYKQYKNISVFGAKTIFAGTYNQIKIMGAGTIEGDVNLYKLSNKGACKVKGSIKAEKLANYGGCTIEQNTEANTVSNYGSMKAKESMSAKSINNYGNLEVEKNLKSDKIKVLGNLKSERSVYAEEITVYGKLVATDMIEADNLSCKGMIKMESGNIDNVDAEGFFEVEKRLTSKEVKLRGGFDINELTADNVTIEKPRFNGIFGNHINKRRFIKKIECNHIKAYRLECETLICVSADIDKNCKIKTIIYKK